MPHRSLIRFGLRALLALAAAAPAVAAATDPHLDPTLMPGGCDACHVGHGSSGSPMLPLPQKQVCLSCHDSQVGVDAQVRRGALAPTARPPLLGPTLDLPARHPLSEVAFSRFEAGSVTCTSCHSPHRRSTPLPGLRPVGTPRPSTRDPQVPEYETCEGCHGSAGPATQSPLDKSRLFDPNSRSFHPVHGPAAESSPSVSQELRGRQISCTDCHGNSDAKGPRGVHASRYTGILVDNYVETDGGSERAETYALCYRCHNRGALFERSPFPLHRLHVVDERASCATCHSPHGSINNRALILFGEQTVISGVSRSTSTGRLAFESEVEGSGSCYLTCHGVDHGPKSYGTAAAAPGALLGLGSAPTLAPPTQRSIKDRQIGLDSRRREQASPPPPS